MPRAPVQQQQAPTTAPPATEASDYQQLWEVATSANPNFPQPGEKESDQQFFRRLALAVAKATDETVDTTGEVWASLSLTAQQWYDGMVDHVNDPNMIVSAPDGYDIGEEGVAEEVAPAEQARKPNTGGLERWRAEQAAKKAAAAQGAPAAPPSGPRRAATPAPAPVATAPAGPPRRQAAPAPAPVATAPAPGRRAAPVAAPAPAAPGRRAAPVAAPAPARAVPVPKEPAGPSSMEQIREYIVYNWGQGVEVTADNIINYMRESGAEVKATTAAGTLSATKSVLATVQRLGHWK